MQFAYPGLIIALLGLDKGGKKGSPPPTAADVLCTDPMYSVPSCCDVLFGSNDLSCEARFLNIGTLEEYQSRCANVKGVSKCCVAGPDGVNKCKDM